MDKVVDEVEFADILTHLDSLCKVSEADLRLTSHRKLIKRINTRRCHNRK